MNRETILFWLFGEGEFTLKNTSKYSCDDSTDISDQWMQSNFYSKLNSQNEAGVLQTAEGDSDPRNRLKCSEILLF